MRGAGLWGLVVTSNPAGRSKRCRKVIRFLLHLQGQVGLGEAEITLKPVAFSAGGTVSVTVMALTVASPGSGSFFTSLMKEEPRLRQRARNLVQVKQLEKVGPGLYSQPF